MKARVPYISKTLPPGKVVRNFPALQVRYVCAPEKISVSREGEGDAVVFHWEDHSMVSFGWDDGSGVEPNVRFIDAFRLRRRFERVSDPDEALLFLRKSGPFKPQSSELKWAAFQGWQRYFLDRQTRGSKATSPEALPSGVMTRVVNPVIQTFVDLDGKRASRAWIHCESVVEAIGATIAIDRFKGARIRHCLFCQRTFEAKTKRKQYCDHDCADAAFRARKLEAKTIKRRGRNDATV